MRVFYISESGIPSTRREVKTYKIYFTSPTTLSALRRLRRLLDSQTLSLLLETVVASFFHKLKLTRGLDVYYRDRHGGHDFVIDGVKVEVGVSKKSTDQLEEGFLITLKGLGHAGVVGIPIWMV